MNAGSVIRIPDNVSKAAGREQVQPGLPGRWTIWSQAGVCPGAHFAVPLDDEARATGVKYATVKVVQPKDETARISLLGTQPAEAMPKVRKP